MLQISQQGRLRWCVENESFNTPKNGGYNLPHKFSRKGPGAQRNYYELLQITHMINQLVEKMQLVQHKVQAAKLTLAALWEDMMAGMRKETIETVELDIALDEQATPVLTLASPVAYRARRTLAL